MDTHPDAIDLAIQIKDLTCKNCQGLAEELRLIKQEYQEIKKVKIELEDQCQSWRVHALSILFKPAVPK